jgi:hypothetical protein
MNIQLIDLPALLGAVAWPLTVVIAFIVFRRSLGDLIIILGKKTRKFSLGVLSLELAEVSEMKPRSLDTEIRELDAGARPQSGPLDLLAQIREQGTNDYIVIDLGSDSAPRWLSSRLYLFAVLLSPVRRMKCFVFVETAGGIRNRFVGIASPDLVRWALARPYPWFEYAYSKALTQLGLPQFDGTTNSLSEYQAGQLVTNFLNIIHTPSPAGTPTIPFDLNRLPEQVPLKNGISEYAKWLDAARLERLLGRDLNDSSVTLLPDKTLNDLAAAVLRQQGRFVAVVDQDRTFRVLIGRSAVLENLAKEVVKETGLNKGSRASTTRT